MKHKVFLSLLLILAILLVSCEIKNDSLSTNSEEKVVVIDFLEQSATRGMTQFPENIPFLDTKYGKEPYDNGQKYGFWISCAVMQSLPILPGVKTMYIKDVESALKDKTVYGYGFPLRVKDIQITSDGIYILYEILEKIALEEYRATGQIEYYYSIKDQKFSYREIVSPLLGKQGRDNIFIFELLNVPVKKTFGGGHSFKAGSLYGNESKFNFYDILFSDQDINKIDQIELFIERDIQMNYKDNEVNVASFNTKYYDGVKSITLDNAIDVSDRKKALNIDATKEFLQQFFASSILTKEKQVYSTIEDFNKTELVKINESIKKATRDFKYLGFPNSFNSDTKIAASISTDNVKYDNLYDDFRHEFVVEAFNECGYTAKKTNDRESPETSQILDDFIKSIFKKLELDEYVNERKDRLADSYNNPYL